MKTIQGETWTATLTDEEYDAWVAYDEAHPQLNRLPYEAVLRMFLINYRMKAMKNAKCFLHPSVYATVSLNVPCAPGGKIPLCSDCDRDPDKIQKVWDKYKDSHAKQIQTFKTPGSPAN